MSALLVALLTSFSPRVCVGARCGRVGVCVYVCFLSRSLAQHLLFCLSLHKFMGMRSRHSRECVRATCSNTSPHTFAHNVQTQAAPDPGPRVGENEPTARAAMAFVDGAGMVLSGGCKGTELLLYQTIA